MTSNSDLKNQLDAVLTGAEAATTKVIAEIAGGGLSSDDTTTAINRVTAIKASMEGALPAAPTA